MENFIPIIIAILLAYIAWENYKINQRGLKIQKDNLRLDLFNRRIKVFEACQNLFSFINREGRPTRQELHKFFVDSSNFEFLFGNEVQSYIDDVNKKGLKLIHLIEQLESERLEIGEKRTRLAKEASELEEWFGEQFTNSRKLFRKYLHFSIDKLV